MFQGKPFLVVYLNILGLLEGGHNGLHGRNLYTCCVSGSGLGMGMVAVPQNFLQRSRKDSPEFSTQEGHPTLRLAGQGGFTEHL